MADQGVAQQVVEFTGYRDRTVIGRALQSNGNDPMKVVNEYYELGDADFSTKYRWDDQAFAADREGNIHQQGVSFHIEAPDQPGYGVTDASDLTPSTGLNANPNDAYYERLALSRPPSRTGNHSPMDRVNQWNMASGNANMSQEDEDLEKALRISAEESGLAVEPQEYGVIDSISQAHLQATTPGINHDLSAPAPAVFGPARREDYNESNWAMVPRSTGAQWNVSRIDSIAPSARQRTPGAPALLVLADRNGQISKADRLGGALTILHSIPMMRNILLSGPPCAGYGNNPAWWIGGAIPRTQAAVSEASSATEPGGAGESAEATGIQAETASQNTDVMDWDEYQDTSVSIEEEVHRLVALLDQSERSFGTLNGLADAMGGTYTLEQRFFEYLLGRDRTAAEPLQTLVRNDVISKERPEVPPEDEEDNKQELCFIEVDVLAQNWPFIHSLTDIWDNIMWQDTVGNMRPPSSSRVMTVIEKQGDVLAVHINSESMTSPPQVPLTLSIERYMDSRRKEAIGLMNLLVHHRKCLSEAQTRLTSLAMPVNTLEARVDPNNPTMIPMSVTECQAKIDQYTRQKKYIQDRARFRVYAESGYDDLQFPHGPETPVGPEDADLTVPMTEEEAMLVMKLESLTEQLEIRQKALESESARVSQVATFHAETLMKLSTVLTGIEPERERWSKLMYLCGVACDDGVVYLCRRKVPTATDSDVNDGVIPVSTPVDQWWRLALMPDSNPAVKAEKTSWERISPNLWTEGKNPLLIYATKDALSEIPVARPSALNQFLRFDDRHFQKEISSADLWGADTDADAQDVQMPATLADDIWAGIGGVGSTGVQQGGWGSPDSMSHGSGSRGELPPGYEDVSGVVGKTTTEGAGEKFGDTKEMVVEGVTVKERLVDISDEEMFGEEVPPPLPRRRPE